MLERMLAWTMVVVLLTPTRVLADPMVAVPTRVVVAIEEVGVEDVAQFKSKRYQDLFRTAIEADPEALEVGGASSARLLGETAAFMFFFSMGLGLLGGTQAAIKEASQVAELSGPVRGRFTEQRANAQLDRRFADALGAALATGGALAVDGPVELVVGGRDQPAPEDDSDARRWAKDNHAGDARGLVLVSLRHGAPQDLSGIYGLARVWKFLPPGATPEAGGGRVLGAGTRPDYYTHHADGTPRRERSAPAAQAMLVRFQEHALFATPVPLADLKQPPPEKVAAESAAIKAEYDPLIETARDRDLRRDLRGQRNRELDKAAKWYPVSFTQHMHDAWMSPPGDAYARLVTRAQADLARRIAAGLAAQP